ncbi:type II toxin-antitoxin system PemK/MazF family toxin [Phormidesmis priestleyi]
MTTTPRKQTYKRGDVILVLFPNSDLQTAKRRPALIVQADNLETGLQQVVIVMITSKLSRSGHPSRVMIARSTSEGLQSGLLSDSVVMTDNLVTVADTEIDRVVGTITTARIDIALRHTLGL